MSALTSLNRNLFGDFFEPSSLGYFIRPLHGEALTDAFKVDVKETPTAYVLHAELPGVKKEDLHITVDASKVTISGEVRQYDEEKKDEKIVRSERYFGSVMRSFQLPQEVDENLSDAKFENGILELTLAKKTSTGTKTIQVK